MVALQSGLGWIKWIKIAQNFAVFDPVSNLAGTVLMETKNCSETWSNDTRMTKIRSVNVEIWPAEIKKFYDVKQKASCYRYAVCMA